jgi:hypothetical protein
MAASAVYPTIMKSCGMSSSWVTRKFSQLFYSYRLIGVSRPIPEVQQFSMDVSNVLIQDIPPLADIHQHHDMVQPFQYVFSTMPASP